MNDPPCLESTSVRRNSLAGRQSVGIFLCAELLALGENLWTASAVNRPVNPTAAEQRVVGCIDNCIDVLFGDVALQEGDARNVAPPAV
jgi:hypothetical protein